MSPSQEKANELQSMTRACFAPTLPPRWGVSLKGCGLYLCAAACSVFIFTVASCSPERYRLMKSRCARETYFVTFLQMAGAPLPRGALK